MIFRQTISMPAVEINIIKKALAWKKGSYYPRLDDGDVIASRAIFDDGIEMDVVCMGVSYDPLKPKLELENITDERELAMVNEVLQQLDAEANA